MSWETANGPPHVWLRLSDHCEGNGQCPLKQQLSPVSLRSPDLVLVGGERPSPCSPLAAILTLPCLPPAPAVSSAVWGAGKLDFQVCIIALVLLCTYHWVLNLNDRRAGSGSLTPQGGLDPKAAGASRGTELSGEQSPWGTGKSRQECRVKGEHGSRCVQSLGAEAGKGGLRRGAERLGKESGWCRMGALFPLP